MKSYVLGALLVSVLAGYGSVRSAADERAAVSRALRPVADTVRDFPVQAFEQVHISDAFVVTIKAGSPFTVKASGRSADITAMDVSTRKGILTIQYKPIKPGKDQNPVINREAVQVTVTLPDLKKAQFQRLTRFTIEGFKRSASVELVASNLATGSAELNADRVILTVDGRSSVTLRGQTAQFEARLQGQSALLAYALQTRTATLALDGMSQAQVSATEELRATANGSSQVTYKGQPTVHTSPNDTSTVRAFAP